MVGKLNVCTRSRKPWRGERWRDLVGIGVGTLGAGDGNEVDVRVTRTTVGVDALGARSGGEEYARKT